MARIPAVLTLLLLTGAGCAGPEPGASVSCGLAALGGPLVAMEGFARGLGLAAPPIGLPTTLPGRFVAGPGGDVEFSHDSSGTLTAMFSVAIPELAAPGFGVLVIDGSGSAMGVLVYDGQPIPGAIRIGNLELADSTRPLFGVRVNRGKVETQDCSLFPTDSSN